MEEFAILNRVVQGSLAEKVTFKQRLEGNERASAWERKLQARRTAVQRLEATVG